MTELILTQTPSRKQTLDVITTENYSILYKNKYTIPQLKTYLKMYNLKQTGKKADLLDRLYHFFKTYKHVVPIQKMYRGHLYRRLNRLRGEAFFCRSLCVNEEDFLTMENVREIDYTQFISYKTSDNVVFGFNIMSIHNIIIKSTKGSPQNPYNRSTIPKDVIDNISHILRISKVLKIPLEISVPNVNENMTESKRIQLRALDTFQYINTLGNYSDPSWFLNLSRNNLLKLYRELYDIWNYRSSLTDDVKIKICSPSGNPFLNERLIFHIDYPIHHLQCRLLNIFDKMVYSGVDADSRTLGAYYILASLTLVSFDAANAMPWLYQSVSYN